MDYKNQIRKFIHENFMLVDADGGLQDDQSFMDSGIIDSTGVLELVSFVEETFEVHVADEELIPDNLDSVEKLHRFILKKKEQAGAVQE